MTPIQLFDDWYHQEIALSTVKLPSVCCLSTIGLDGYPNARVMSLVEVTKEGFVITGPLASRKGLELQYINKVALTFWWTATEKQVRIQGDVRFITNSEADVYFQRRNRDAQLVSLVSEQGEEIMHPEVLEIKYSQAETQFRDKALERPLDWGGFFIKPIRIEFHAFKDTGFHQRTLFEKTDHIWEMKMLQP